MTRALQAELPSILLLTDSLEIGGLEAVVVRLANELVGRGHHVGVAAEAGGHLWSRVDPRVRRHHLPAVEKGPLRLGLALWLRREIARGRYDVVHAHQRGVALFARLAVRGLKVVVVEHVHNVFLPVSQLRTSFRSPELIACAPAVRSMLINDYGRPESSVSMVMNTVADLGEGEDLTLPAVASASAAATSPFHLVVVARLTEQKDPTRFVRVMAALEGAEAPVTATWVGDGELRDEAEALASELGVTTLSFVGDSDDVRSHVLAADLLVLTSRWEGLPLTLLEGLSLGRGAIVPDAGSCSQAVVDGVNGRVFDVDATPEAIAAVIRESVSVDTLAEWGDRSRQRYESEFGGDRLIDGVTRVYARALGRPWPETRLAGVGVA